MPPNSDLPRNYLRTNNMKRHLLIAEMTESAEQKRFTPTNLAILGNYQTLVTKDSNVFESERHQFKKPKLQVQTEPEITMKVNDSNKIEDEKDRKHNEDNKNLHYLDLVSSAACIVYDESLRKLEQKQNCQRAQDQVYNPQVRSLEQRRQNLILLMQRAQDQACSSQASVNAAVSRTSRSSSICSEYSVYRSYEMELPKQPLGAITGRLPRPPRLPTASDIPQTEYSSNSCQLNTRRYGEQYMGLQQGGNDGNSINSNNENNDNNPPSEVIIKTVIYQ